MSFSTLSTPSPPCTLFALRARLSRRVTASLFALLVLAAVFAVGGVRPDSAEAAGKPTVRYGSTGPAVREVQTVLRVTPRSGYFGRKTLAAVKRWQRAHHIRPTGVVGPATWKTLRRAQLLQARKARASRSATRVSSVAALNWTALARCESGGNPRAVNPAGYYGLYQFGLATWRGLGGLGYPHQASVTEQTAMAHKLYRQAGSAPWPHCGKYLYR